MAKATQAEIARRIEELLPLVIDCLSLREIRAFTQAKTNWGQLISEVQLKRYLARARKTIRAQAPIDHTYEFMAAKHRDERALARASAGGDLRTYLAANAQLIELLGLAAPTRIELSGSDLEAARAQLEAEIAEEMADRETDS
jgi:precorrin-4 methylase